MGTKSLWFFTDLAKFIEVFAKFFVDNFIHIFDVFIISYYYFIQKEQFLVEKCIFFQSYPKFCTALYRQIFNRLSVV